MIKFNPPKFTRRKNDEFITTLRARVNQYFTEKNISKHANATMVIKTISMLLIYFVPFFILLSGAVSAHLGLFFLMWIIMGLGAAGIGMSVMHDANHGAYSKNPTINTLLGSVIYFVGGNSNNWIIQHNVLHHTYTNINEMDEDINGHGFVRLCPHQEKKPMHRFQYIYAWFLYGLTSIMWATSKDIRQIYRYKKLDLLKMLKEPFGKIMTKLIVSKIFYFAYILVLPIMVMPNSWGVIVLGFLLMHFVLGLVLTSVFQLAHVMPNMKFPLPDKKGNMENQWAIHQLLTTCDFSPNGKFVSWYVGGLNYQIEHHLFPTICHVHYKQISKIVKQTAKEFGIPYYCQPTFVTALLGHGKMLKELG